ncbi:MAG: threonine ammonia-lyase IlvA [Pseudomonadota bacterium]
MTDFQDNARAAAAEMHKVFPPTPLQRNAFLSELYATEIYLKREDLSPVRSYKNRGAFNAMGKAIAKGANRFVCASAGNHAQGVALACHHYGVKGRIYMPVTTPQQKIEKTAVFGRTNIEIILEGDYFDETLAAAQAYAASDNAVMLAPFDDADVIQGQASVGIEIEVQLNGVPDLLICPVGGGGLSSGLKSYFGPTLDLRLVEPNGGRSLHAALENGALVTLPHVDNFVDGAAVARIGEANWAVLKDQPIEKVYGVEEDRLCATITQLLNIEGIVLEPAGALSIDLLKDLSDDIRGKRVVCIVSGGNFDFERLPDVKERALRYSGLKKYYILRMPQRPGALREFLNLLGPNDDIARFEYLKKSARNFGSVLLGIESTTAEGFPALEEKIISRGFSFQDITNDEILAQFLI